MAKTTYVLGAGFSMQFGAPSQAKLLKSIYDLKDHEKYCKNPQVKKWIRNLDTFIIDALRVSEHEKIYYSLEDIYTPIDKSILESISFREYTPRKLADLRDQINKLVMIALRVEIEENSSKRKDIDIFSKHIVDKCRKRISNEKFDPVSIITTNWDILLDNSIFKEINKDPIPKGHKFSGVLDYCCYISSLDENDEKIKPGLYALGKGRYNVKLLKLHGSLNWLQCPKCARLYVKLYHNFNGAYIFDKKYCRHCEKNFSNNKGETNILSTNLITPTFLKNLNNVQNKLVWQNAAIELSEADKIVFLGYSLPHADFEFKQLLSRMVKSEAKIEVVLIENDDPNKTNDFNYNTAGYRFQNFFSGRDIHINYGGVEEYLKVLN